MWQSVTATWGGRLSQPVIGYKLDFQPMLCYASSSLLTGQCLGNLCTFGTTCTNNIRDNDESDVDCGGINSGCLACCWSE